MLSRLYQVISLSILSVFMLNLSVQAELQSFRDETKLQITVPADKPLGEYLAYLISLRQALAQAQPFIESQAFVKQAQLNDQGIKTLSFLLLQNQFSYPSSTAERANPLEVVYKTKLDYETLTFPGDISEIYFKSIGDWFFVQYLLEQNKKMEADLTGYLQEVTFSKDAAYQTLLRQTQGKVLQQKYQAFQLYDESFLFQLKTGQTTKATETMEQIIALDPDSVAYKLRYALLLVQMDSPVSYDRALALMSELIDKIKTDDGVRLVRSYVYFSQGLLFDLALIDVNKVIETNPRNNFAYLLKGLIALKMRNRPQALKSFESACELNSKEKVANCNSRLLEFANRRLVESSNRRLRNRRLPSLRSRR